MFKGPAETAEFCRELREIDLPDADMVICPPFVSLEAAVQVLAGTEVGVFAQNCHWAEEGAFTGEVSPSMLRELGVYGTLVGHSERRQYFGETDETVGRRVEAALAAGLDVIACVGETEAERAAGDTEAVLSRQLSVLSGDDGLVIAYEPVWAIGTGKVATNEQAQEVHAAIREHLKKTSAELAEVTRILYGGSVKADNAAGLLACPDIDGALVGGAALDAEGFAKIAKAAPVKN
jgi:triosephosphate isomerase